MTVALHNCSNKDDSGVGSRGSAKWNKQMATERKKSKENTHLGFQFKAAIHFLFYFIFCAQDKLSETAHFCRNIVHHMFPGLFFLTTCLNVPAYSIERFSTEVQCLGSPLHPTLICEGHCRLTKIPFRLVC